MNKLVYFLFLILFFPLSNALCDSNQIDINSASLNELDKLSGIGEVKAQSIIDSRQFSSVDDLINVKGIGEITLEKIKIQDLACIDLKDIEEETIPEESIQEFKEEIQTPIKGEIKVEEKSRPEIINLNPKTIKTEDSTPNSSTNFKYFVIGVIFLLLSIYLIRPKKLKNEFN